jgi:deoxyribodipyrimidine photo-lyase
MPACLVWLKKDLRVRDHAPLALAAGFEQAAALYVIEPSWLTSPEFDTQHLSFALACLAPLRAELATRGLPLLVRVGAVINVFAALRREFAFTHLASHEEIGPLWSYERDQAVARWCRSEGVSWQEFAQSGVVRRLKSRSGWAARWQRRMDAPMVATPSGLAGARGVDVRDLPTLPQLGVAPQHRASPLAGEAAAHDTLHSFLHQRGANYRKALSSPLTAEQGCSRLSAHLAFGTLSLRTVHQATEARIAELKASGDAADQRFAYHLRGFAGRLRWHCHFMQKLEDEPQIEQRNFARAYDGLRDDASGSERFDAWCEGRTGYPMVDACMRSMVATGWLNFRMRAMLVSFAAYHLWLHWREPGLFLARQFLDFEPGIHWSQMQMQSGTTGINTLRMYSPAKQAADHDPEGVFIRRWVPEIGSAAYPQPIVDERSAMAHAKQRMYALRGTASAREEAQAIQDKHGSRKSGLPPTKRARAKPADTAQPSLFE